MAAATGVELRRPGQRSKMPGVVRDNTLAQDSKGRRLPNQDASELAKAWSLAASNAGRLLVPAVQLWDLVPALDAAAHPARLAAGLDGPEYSGHDVDKDVWGGTTHVGTHRWTARFCIRLGACSSRVGTHRWTAQLFIHLVACSSLVLESLLQHGPGHPSSRARSTMQRRLIS